MLPNTTDRTGPISVCRNQSVRKWAEKDHSIQIEIPESDLLQRAAQTQTCCDDQPVAGMDPDRLASGARRTAVP
jgi:hypothetical protein